MIQILLTTALIATIWAFALQIKDMVKECKSFFFVPDEEPEKVE